MTQPDGKNLGGRPRKEIDINYLKNMCQYQCTAEECAGIFEISVDTLDRRIKEIGFSGFAEFFKMYSVEGKISLRRNQYHLSKTNAAMAIWLGKQWLGQKDAQDLNLFDGQDRVDRDEKARIMREEMIKKFSQDEN